MILYLHGFASGPESKKGVELARRFARLGVPFHRADLTPGPRGFEEATPITMLEEAERLVAAYHPRALMGSSLGGWLAAILASRDATIERLVLLAPAFRLHARWLESLSEEEEARWRKEGLLVDHYASGTVRRIGWQFIEDAGKLPAYPDVSVPALCISGRRDTIVPPQDVAAFVTWTPEAKLVTVDDGHELTASIDRIFEESREFLKPVLAEGPVPPPPLPPTSRAR